MRQILSQKQVPLDILGAATAYRLGTPEKVFEASQELRFFRLTGFAALFVGCLILLVFGVAYPQLFSWWPFWQALLIPLIGLIWLIFGGWVLLAPHFYTQPQVYLCPEGLIFSADTIETVRWDQLERLWKESDGRANGKRRYIIRRSDESLLTFTNELQHIDLLGALMESEITRRLLPRAMVAYRAGGSVSFDEISVSRQGLAIRPLKRLLPWTEFHALTIDEQAVLIHIHASHEPLVRLKTANLPNIDILRRLVDHAWQEHTLNHAPHVMAYKAGQPLSFGRLRIDQQGIQLELPRPICLAWEEIGAIGIGPQEMLIARYGEQHTREWYTLPLRELHNLEQLREVIRYILLNASP